MKVELKKTFRFEAAHHLPFAPDGHRCRNVHGHGYQVDVVVDGEVDAQRRWYVDYGDIAAAIEPILKGLDHRLLNDVPGLEAGTAEMLALFLWTQARDRLPGLKEVTVRETATSSCTYRGE